MKNNSSIFFYAVILCVAFTACSQSPTHKEKSSSIPSHTAWGALLDEHVNSLGDVDYRGFLKDSTLLNAYLHELAINPPSEYWSKNDQLAYWINLYNAATIQLVLRHYPLSSIKEIGSSIQIPFINTPWQIEFITIKDQLFNLDNIEHNIIRKEFEEPRIHFALVCAAKSCPILRNEAYQGANLDEQLTDQATIFLADKTKNIISKDRIIISKLFKWYGRDFKKKTSLIAHLNQYSPVQIDEHAEIDYMDYEWALNEQ